MNLSEYSEMSRHFGEELTFVKRNSLVESAKLSQVQRRLLVKSFFSHFEVSTHFLKQQVLEWDEENERLTAEELVIANEWRLELDNHGQIQKRDLQPRTLPSFLNALSLAQTSMGLPTAIDKQSDDWFCVTKSLEVRNRVTHPRQLADMDISDTEAGQLEKATQWFLLFMLEIITKMPG